MEYQIPFTQYVLPHGRKKPVSVAVDLPTYERSKEIIASGLAFECEVLGNGTVSLTITDPEHGDLDIRLAKNGPDVLGAVKSLVMEFVI